MFATALSQVTNEIRTLGMGLRNDSSAVISHLKITRFDGQKKMNQARRRHLERYFLAAEIQVGRKTLVAYQLCADLMDSVLKSNPGVSWE